MEKTKEQLQAEIGKANMIIQRLQQRLGALQGSLAEIEVDRDLYAQHIQAQEKGNEDSNKEE